MYLIAVEMEGKQVATQIFDDNEEAKVFFNEQVKKLQENSGSTGELVVRDGVTTHSFGDLVIIRMMELGYREYTLVNGVIGFVNEYEKDMKGMSAIIGKQMIEKVRRELGDIATKIEESMPAE